MTRSCVRRKSYVASCLAIHLGSTRGWGCVDRHGVERAGTIYAPMARVLGAGGAGHPGASLQGTWPQPRGVARKPGLSICGRFALTAILVCLPCDCASPDRVDEGTCRKQHQSARLV